MKKYIVFSGFVIAYTIAIFFTNQASESLFISVPIPLALYFTLYKDAWKNAHHKTVFISLPAIGIIMAFLGAGMPGCTILIPEVVWGAWFFLGLAVLLWTIGIGREIFIAKFFQKKTKIFARIISAVLFFIVLTPLLLAIVTIHRVKYGCAWNPLQMFNFPYTSLTLKTKDGLSLSAWFVPSEKSKKSVLICHGIGANKSNFIYAMDFLVRAGYNVLIFDFRGHGESNGHTCSVGYWERLDVQAAYEYLQTSGYTIYAMGYSMGCASLLHFASYGSKFEAIILDSPFDSLPEIAQTRLFFIPSFLKKICTNGMLALAWILCQADSWSVDNASFLRKITCPVLIFHGGEDTVIPEVHSRSLQGNNLKRIVTPGFHHVQTLMTEDEQYRKIALDFMAGK